MPAGTAVIEIQDSNSGAVARIRPDIGFNCFSFRPVINGEPVELLHAAPDFADAGGSPTRNGIPLLFPFAGRIRNGTYDFSGKTYQITTALPNGANAIHGFVLNRPWRVISREPNRVTAEFQGSIDAPETVSEWPGDYRIRATYTVSDRSLIGEYALSNPGATPIPVSFGTHPYFAIPLGGDPASCRVVVPAEERWVLADLLPTGDHHPVDPAADLREGKTFPEISVDAVFSNLHAVDGLITTTIEDITSGVRLQQVYPQHFRYSVVYTPPERDTIAIEPYTSLVDPFAMTAQGIDPELIMLEPGAEWRTTVTISAEAI